MRTKEQIQKYLQERYYYKEYLEVLFKTKTNEEIYSYITGEKGIDTISGICDGNLKSIWSIRNKSFISWYNNTWKYKLEKALFIILFLVIMLVLLGVAIFILSLIPEEFRIYILIPLWLVLIYAISKGIE